jgi:small subunit ribosomal protein S9
LQRWRGERERALKVGHLDRIEDTKHLELREFEQFFVTNDTRRAAAQPLVVTETRNNYDIWANVDGGGPTGQAGAVSLGVARALLKENVNFDKLLRDNGLLTRDSRKVERKKYGRHKARRSTQFSKR